MEIVRGLREATEESFSSGKICQSQFLFSSRDMGGMRVIIVFSFPARVKCYNKASKMSEAQPGI